MMKITDFVFPKTLEEAQKMLLEYGDRGALISGGTSLTYLKEQKTEKIAINISRLPLKEITQSNNEFHIGSLNVISDLRTYSATGWKLSKIAKSVSTEQIRNMTTIGGNVSKLFYWSEFPVVFLSLGAKFKTTSKNVDADEFFKSQPFLSYAADEILLSVTVPKITKGTGLGFCKDVRTTAGLSTLTVSCYIKLDGDKITFVRIALGGCLTIPVRLKNVEKQLIGKIYSKSLCDSVSFDEIKSFKLLPKEGMSEDYCRHLIQVNVKDSVSKAVQNAKEESI